MSVQQDRAQQRSPGDAPEASASHSGRLLVRMPATLHAELAQAARREGVSLNAFVIGALSGSVAWRSDAGERRLPEPQQPPAPTPAPIPPVVAPAALPSPAPSSRALSVALAVNLIVVLLAAAAAIGLVIAAWPS